jgi:hypothetical protein
MAEKRPEVPGYTMAHLLGFGATGEVWLARESSTGAPVALKRVRTPGDRAAGARMRREASVLASVEHPHLVRLRRVLSLTDEIVLVLDYAAGGSLARLLGARDRLTPGEVVTLGAPLADALAAVHQRGIVHGDITPSNVLLTADGRPLLADLGLSRIAGASPGEVDGTTGYVDPAVLHGQQPSKASDVYGLAAVCWSALTGVSPQAGGQLPAEVPAALARCLASALDLDAGSRPTAVELGVALYDACEPVPLRMVSTDSIPAERPRVDLATRRVRPAAQPTRSGPPRPSHRRARRSVPWRLVGGVGAVSVGVTGAVVAGLSWAQAGGGHVGVALPSATLSAAASAPGETSPATAAPSAPATRESATTSPEPAWREVLDGLDATRERAFAAADIRALHDVYAPGSRALKAEERAVLTLAERGLRARGHDFRLVDVVPVSRVADRAVLSVTDTVGAHRLVDARGAVVEEREGRGKRSFQVVLVHRAGRWLISEIAPT